jgi:hypothetical protein
MCGSGLSVSWGSSTRLSFNGQEGEVGDEAWLKIHTAFRQIM